MADADTHPNYVAFWIWLMALLIVSVVVSYLPIGTGLAVFIIFVLSFIKAVLVALNFMHLKTEHVVIYAIACAPIVAFFILWLVLYPEIGLCPLGQTC